MNVEEIQRALLRAGYNVGRRGADGQFGPATRAAMQLYQQSNGLAKTDQPDAVTIAMLAGKLPARQQWPQQKDCNQFYGNPRGRDPSRASSAWEIASLTTIVAPFRMTYAGRPITRIRIHKKCGDSLLRVFNAVWIAAGREQKLVDAWGVSIYGGAYNYRLMRGGDALSMHSFGCAIDLDPSRNGFGDRTPHFATVPEVLKAFADEDWTWGGGWSKPDGMHWQAAHV